MYIIIMTIMSRHKPPKTPDAKEAALRAQHALHPHPESVEDENFQTHEFFDPRDLVQVRYEMLRRHRVEGKPVTEIASTFGTSRQAFYKSTSAFEAQGVSGLLPKKRGPKRAHKCTDEVLDFVEQWQTTAGAQESASEAVRERFGMTINPRSLERALARRKKKRKKKGKKP
jgi:transposase